MHQEKWKTIDTVYIKHEDGTEDISEVQMMHTDKGIHIRNTGVGVKPADKWRLSPDDQWRSGTLLYTEEGKMKLFEEAKASNHPIFADLD